MDYSLVLEQGQKQQLSQYQIMSLNMLSLDNGELEEFLEKEYEENPLLEHTSLPKSYTFTEKDTSRDESRDYMFQLAQEKEKDIRLYFMEQLKFNDFTHMQWKIISYMISSVSETGIMEMEMSDIAQELGVSKEECEKCRQALTRLEPAGVFALSVQEALKLQLERLGIRTPTTDTMIDQYLEELGAGHFSKVGKSMHMAPGEVRSLFGKIKSLSPYPLHCISGANADYIVPDILCLGSDKDYEVVLNDNWIGNYSLSDYYLNMMAQTKDADLKDYFRKKHERCKYIISGIEKRRETILKVTGAIIERQRDYIFYHKPLKPMNMQDIADDVEMNISTVSRAIKGKYMQYDYGVVLLKELFCAAASGQNSEDKTASDIKKEIKAIVDHEDKSAPYSDQKISELLKERNISISRRTVAKYREEIGIAGTYVRRSAG